MNFLHIFQTLPVHVLKQVFCRFGNLIDVYLLNNRNCGYAKYSSGESAKQVFFFYLFSFCISSQNYLCNSLTDIQRLLR